MKLYRLGGNRIYIYFAVVQHSEDDPAKWAIATSLSNLKDRRKTVSFFLGPAHTTCTFICM